MRSIAAGTSLVVFALAAVPSLAAQDDFRWSGRVAPGNQVEVVGIAADIDATSTGGGNVEVTATGLEDGARIEVEQHSGGVTFCVIHAGLHRSSGRGHGRCSQEGNGQHHNWRNQEDVEVHVRVPAGVRFAASTVSGDVDVEGLTADVEAHSVSGDVHVSTRGSVEAGSVSGDLDLTMGRLPSNGTLEFRTVSGDVEITLPRDAGAELHARTLSGDIDSDFPLEVSGRDRGRGYHIEVGQRARGTIGRGGARLDVETVSGDITVHRG
jgi:hypothetical protein